MWASIAFSPTGLILAMTELTLRELDVSKTIDPHDILRKSLRRNCMRLAAGLPGPGAEATRSNQACRGMMDELGIRSSLEMSFTTASQLCRTGFSKWYTCWRGRSCKRISAIALAAESTGNQDNVCFTDISETYGM